MSELCNKIRKVLLKETKKENLKPGDHIYTFTGANSEDHGIYLNSGCVIHFAQGRQGARSNDCRSTCPNCSDHGVVTSCINCFLSGRDHLYLFEYDVNLACILTKLAGGATLAPADPSQLVESRASSFLVINSNDSGSYYRFINNDKDFAMYCKTGLLVIDNINFRRWKAAASLLAATFIFFLFLQQSTAATFPGVAATCFGLYCIYRFGSDIGARPNVIKVDEVRTLPDADKKLSSAARGFRPIQFSIDLLIVLLMFGFSIQLLLITVRTWSEPLQLLSKTPWAVWILACVILFYLAILQKGLISNKIHKRQLKPGDHIYTWRRKSYNTYAHHGIYVRDSGGEVIHLNRGGDDILPSSASSRSSENPIGTTSATNNQATTTRVEYCSLDSFLDGDELYLYKYGVSLAFFITQFLGGTCTLGSSDPPETVMYRSRNVLNNPYEIGAYNLFNNNCEDFAIYCKTKAPPRKFIINLGRNGQIMTYCGVLYAIIIFRSTFWDFGMRNAIINFMSIIQPVILIGVAATVYFIYSMIRFAADVTHYGNAYQVRLITLPSWRRLGQFPIMLGFLSLGGKKLLF